MYNKTDQQFRADPATTYTATFINTIGIRPRSITIITMYRPTNPRRTSISSIISSWSAHSDDAAVPNHPSATNADEQHPTVPFPRRQSSVASELSCDGMTGDETRGLWRCMLELQERYGCYNSTRIDLAVGAEDAIALMRAYFSSAPCARCG